MQLTWAWEGGLVFGLNAKDEVMEDQEGGLWSLSTIQIHLGVLKVVLIFPPEE